MSQTGQLQLQQQNVHQRPANEDPDHYVLTWSNQGYHLSKPTTAVHWISSTQNWI